MNNLYFYQDLKSIEDLKKNSNIQFDIKFNELENCWQGYIEFRESKFYFKIFNTFSYPLEPPYFYSFVNENYSHLRIHQQWRRHLFGDGRLCLFTNDLGESGWKPQYRIDIVLLKFQSFLQNTFENTLSESHLSEDFDIRNFSLQGEFYISDKFFNKIKKRNGKFCQIYIINPINITKLNPFGFNIPIFVFPYNLSNTEYRYLQNIPITYKIKARIYFLDNAKYLKFIKTLLDGNQLKNFLKSNEIKFNEIHYQPECFFIGNKDDPNSNTIFLILFSLQNINLIPPFQITFTYNPVYSYYVIDKDRRTCFEAIFQRPKDYLEDKYSMLEEKKIIIIGLGSLGSKIAEELARNGIKHFALYDFDIYKPENVARHIGALSLIGKPKVEVVATVLKDIAPEIKVESFVGNPLQPNLILEFIKKLTEFHLVVIAIDSPSDENEINRQCIIHKIPAIYSVCLEHAHYGRIFRVIPGETACYECIHSHIEHFPNIFPSYESLGSVPKEQSPYYHPGVPGLNLDIWEIALKTVRLCLQTLARGNPPQEKIPDSPFDHILISNYNGWIFTEQYQIKPFKFERLKDCSICGTAEKACIKEDIQADFEALKKKYFI